MLRSRLALAALLGVGAVSCSSPIHHLEPNSDGGASTSSDPSTTSGEGGSDSSSTVDSGGSTASSGGSNASGGSGGNQGGGGSAARSLIGFVPGAGVVDPVAAISAFSAWMNNGTGVEVVTDYGYPNLGSTTRMKQLGGDTDASKRRGPLTKSSNAMPLVFSTTLAPSGSLDNVISGHDDAAFKTEAENMKAYGFSNVIWRLGWECDGWEFTWAVYHGANNTNDVASRAGKFASAFRHVVALIRAIDPHARFEYNSGKAENPIPGTNPQQYFAANDPGASYPGDDVVDFIGTDNYGSDYHSYNYSTHTKGTPEQIWQESLKPLGEMKTFADSHHKPFVISEWGEMIRADGHGTNDDPYFMEQFLLWANANTAYHTYFNAYDAHNPNAKLRSAAHQGDTSLLLDSVAGFAVPFADSKIGFLRYGTGTHIRQIDYYGVNASNNALTGIKTSGFGIIPAGGIASGTSINIAVQNMCQIAIGKNDDDVNEGDQGFRTNPDFTLAGAKFIAGVQR